MGQAYKSYDPLNPSMFVQTSNFLDEFEFYHLSQLSKPIIRRKLATYFKFVFVREPWHRLLSAYRDIYEYDKPQTFNRGLFYDK